MCFLMTCKMQVVHDKIMFHFLHCSIVNLIFFNIKLTILRLKFDKLDIFENKPKHIATLDQNDSLLHSRCCRLNLFIDFESERRKITGKMLLN